MLEESKTSKDGRAPRPFAVPEIDQCKPASPPRKYKPSGGCAIIHILTDIRPAFAGAETQKAVQGAATC